MPLANRRTHDDSSKRPDEVNNIKLMDFNEIVWPNVFKSIKNMFMAFLIRGYYDNQFDPKGFLKGAEQAVATVSSSISSGDFNSLNGLVTEEALEEIKKNYYRLSHDQRKFIAIDTKDLFLKLIYEIGMIFDDESKRKFVEITALMQGFHGLGNLRNQSVEELSKAMESSPDQIYICNYRFIKEYTKGVEGSWVINKLNHFCPRRM